MKELIKWSTQSVLKFFERNCYKSSELVTVDQVPEVLKEPFIYTGYRQVYKSWSYYLRSIVHLHNETFNVWTHVFGTALVLLHLAHLLNHHDIFNDKSPLPFLIFETSALISMASSACAHFLHSKSPWHHSMLFMLDYAGITIAGYGIGTAVILVSASRPFQHSFLQPYLLANIIVSWVVYSLFSIAKTQVDRNRDKRTCLMLLAIVMQGIFLCLPIAQRYTDCIKNPACSLSSLNNITLVLLLDMLSAITYGARLPERLMPGCFDIYGHSHQIFHAILVFNFYVRFNVIENEKQSRGLLLERFPSNATIFIQFLIMVVGHAVIFLWFLRYFRSHPKSKKVK